MTTCNTKFLEPYLDDLERRIDPRVEDQLTDQWLQFIAGKIPDPIFSPRRSRNAPPSIEWPHVMVNDILDNYEMMALQQLDGCSRFLEGGGGGILAVRCNYGAGILSSLFGAEVFIMERSFDTLPLTRPLEGGLDQIRMLLDKGVPDIRNGLGARVLECGALFKKIFSPYPGISRYVHIFHPDVQGPMDIAELLRGSSLFSDMLLEPDLIKGLLDLITATYVQFMLAWTELIGRSDPSVHWSMVHRGTLMLRDDSVTNLSPDLVREFVIPYDQRLLDQFGGGAVHFCGRGDHYIDQIAAMRGVHAVNMTQPELNDVETIYRNTIDKGIKLLGLDRRQAESSLARGRHFHGNVHCW